MNKLQNTESFQVENIYIKRNKKQFKQNIIPHKNFFYIKKIKKFQVEFFYFFFIGWEKICVTDIRNGKQRDVRKVKIYIKKKFPDLFLDHRT
jgi:hypothetical protein